MAGELDARAAGDLAGATSGLAYLQAMRTEETVRAREADSAVAATLLQQARRLVENGVSPAIDATRSEVSFAAVRTQLEVARNARDRSRLDLLRTLDLPPRARSPWPIRSVPRASTYRPSPRVPQSLPGLTASSCWPSTRGPSPHGVACGRFATRICPTSWPTGVHRKRADDRRTAGELHRAAATQRPHPRWIPPAEPPSEQRARIDAQELRERDIGNQIETEARAAVLNLASARQQVGIAGERLRLADQELAQAEERFRAGVAGSVETTPAQSSESRPATR